MLPTRNLLLLLLGMVILTIAGMQFYWLERLQQSNQARNHFWLEKVTFLLCNQVNETLWSARATLTPIDWEPTSFIDRYQTRLAAWRKASAMPDLIESIWFVDGETPERNFAIDPKSGRRTSSVWDVDGWLHAWLFDPQSVASPDVPPLVISENSDAQRQPRALVLVLNSEVLFQQALPDGFQKVAHFLQDDLGVTASVTRSGHPERHLFSWAMTTLSRKPYEQSIHFFPPELSTGPFAGPRLEHCENGPDQLPPSRDFMASAGYFRMCISLTGDMSQASMRLSQWVQWTIASGTVLVMVVCFVLGFAFLRKTEQLTQQQMAFVAGVSHELRTPLAAIASAGDNLAEAVVTDPKRVTTYGRLIREESQRLKTMVENVLGYAKTFSKTTPIGGTCDPALVLDGVISSWCHQLEGRKLKLVVQTQAALPKIAIDADGWRTILTNLVSNAVKYSPAGTTIALALEKKHPKNRTQVCFSIADQGPGIPQKEQALVFQRFYRGRLARESQVPGSGLGLSIVAQLVKQYGGHLSLKSRPGLGTRFSVTFPVVTPGPSESHRQGGTP